MAPCALPQRNSHLALSGRKRLSYFNGLQVCDQISPKDRGVSTVFLGLAVHCLHCSLPAREGCRLGRTFVLAGGVIRAHPAVHGYHHCDASRPIDATPKRRQKRSHRPTRLQLPSMAQLDQRTNAAKEFARLVSAIEADLDGADRLSQVERSLVEGFAGCSVALQALNVRLIRDGEQGLDLGLLALLGGALCRIGSRIGLQRRPRDVSPSLSDLLKASTP